MAQTFSPNKNQSHYNSNNSPSDLRNSSTNHSHIQIPSRSFLNITSFTPMTTHQQQQQSNLTSASARSHSNKLQSLSRNSPAIPQQPSSHLYQSPQSPSPQQQQHTSPYQIIDEQQQLQQQPQATPPPSNSNAPLFFTPVARRIIKITSKKSSPQQQQQQQQQQHQSAVISCSPTQQPNNQNITSTNINFDTYSISPSTDLRKKLLEYARHQQQQSQHPQLQHKLHQLHHQQTSNQSSPFRYSQQMQQIPTPETQEYHFHLQPQHPLPIVTQQNRASPTQFEYERTKPRLLSSLSKYPSAKTSIESIQTGISRQSRGSFSSAPQNIIPFMQNKLKNDDLNIGTATTAVTTTPATNPTNTTTTATTVGNQSSAAAITNSITPTSVDFYRSRHRANASMPNNGQSSPVFQTTSLNHVPQSNSTTFQNSTSLKLNQIEQVSSIIATPRDLFISDIINKSRNQQQQQQQQQHNTQKQQQQLLVSHTTSTATTATTTATTTITANSTTRKHPQHHRSFEKSMESPSRPIATSQTSTIFPSMNTGGFHAADLTHRTKEAGTATAPSIIPNLLLNQHDPLLVYAKQNSSSSNTSTQQNDPTLTPASLSGTFSVGSTSAAAVAVAVVVPDDFLGYQETNSLPKRQQQQQQYHLKTGNNNKNSNNKLMNQFINRSADNHHHNHSPQRKTRINKNNNHNHHASIEHSFEETSSSINPVTQFQNIDHFKLHIPEEPVGITAAAAAAIILTTSTSPSSPTQSCSPIKKKNHHRRVNQFGQSGFRLTQSFLRQQSPQMFLNHMNPLQIHAAELQQPPTTASAATAANQNVYSQSTHPSKLNISYMISSAAQTSSTAGTNSNNSNSNNYLFSNSFGSTSMSISHPEHGINSMQQFNSTLTNTNNTTHATRNPHASTASGMRSLRVSGSSLSRSRQRNQPSILLPEDSKANNQFGFQERTFDRLDSEGDNDGVSPYYGINNYVIDLRHKI